MNVLRRRIKTSTFSLVVLIAIMMMFFLDCSCVATSDPYPTSSGITNLDNAAKNLSTFTNTTQRLHPTDDITIITPDGSTITDLSTASVNVQVNDKTRTIYFSSATDAFSNIDFSKSIDGLDDFNLYIDFTSYNTVSKLDSIIANYTIDWGNGDISTGQNVPISTLSYAYKKEGKYPVTIRLTDSDGITYAYLTNQSFKLTTGQFVTLWVGENKETVAISSAAGTGGVAVLGFALTETGKYKLLSLLFLLIPLYTRIQKEDVLDQFVRGEIYGYIKTNPGVHYNQIIRELDVKNGTLSYHLHMLEKTGMVKSRKEGLRYRVFYPTGVKFPKEERYRLTELQMSVIKTIKENEGISQKEIAQSLNLKHQTVSYNVKVLQQAGFILLRKKGRTTSCYIIEEGYSDQAV